MVVGRNNRVVGLNRLYSKGFEPRSDIQSCSVIVWVRVVLKRTVVGDCDQLTFRQTERKSSSLDYDDDFRSGCQNVTVTDNSPFQYYPHPDDHTTRSTKEVVK